MLWTLAVVVLSLTPGDADVSIQLFNGADKLIHFFLYFVLVSLWVFAMLDNSINPLMFLIFGIFLGFLMECGQYFVPFRSFEFHDILANTLGCLLAYFLPVYKK